MLCGCVRGWVSQISASNLAHYLAVKGREGQSLQFNLAINVGVWWYYSVSETQIFHDKDDEVLIEEEEEDEGYDDTGEREKAEGREDPVFLWGRESQTFVLAHYRTLYHDNFYAIIILLSW